MKYIKLLEFINLSLVFFSGVAWGDNNVSLLNTRVGAQAVYGHDMNLSLPETHEQLLEKKYGYLFVDNEDTDYAKYSGPIPIVFRKQIPLEVLNKFSPYYLLEHSNNQKIVEAIEEALSEDSVNVSFPVDVQDGDFKELLPYLIISPGFHDNALFISKNQFMPLHSDSDNIWTVQLSGAKDWIIVPFEELEKIQDIYQRNYFANNFKRTSDADPDIEEIMILFIFGVQSTFRVRLEAGDILYIPNKMYHYVIPVGDEVSISLARRYYDS